MNAKFTKLLIMLSIILGACSSDVQQTNNELLTLSPWTAERKPLLNGSMPKLTENHIFHRDGTYTQEFGDGTGQVVMKSTGKWRAGQRIMKSISR